MVDYEEEWQYSYRELWQSQLQQRSRSLLDLISEAIQNEAIKLDYTLFRYQKWDPSRRQRLCLSRKPKLMHDLVQLQVKALIANLGDMAQTGFTLH